ncbi:MAG: magnesium transporter [Putridiphycobacter sp.]
MKFELTKALLDDIRSRIDDNDSKYIQLELNKLHPADIADIAENLSVEETKFIFDHLEEEVSADALVELDDDYKEKLLDLFSTKEIAEHIDQLDTDDAADILGALSEEEKDEAIAQMQDKEHASEVIDLLKYNENSAGGLMQTEFIQAKESWSVKRCVIELRRQAEEVEKVYTIYVVNDDFELTGVLSLKRLLFAKPDALIKDLYHDENIHFVKTHDDKEEVAELMQKYDLISIPVVDRQKKLVGRITIDDVVDVIQEEAERDYQLASGITENVESTASIFKNAKSRLPWILIGIFGGILSSLILKNYEDQIAINPILAFFIPLITATGGNIGVQSSAIVVQSLASNDFNPSGILKRISKELLVGVIIGITCGALVFGYNYLLNDGDMLMGITIGVAIFVVVIIAAVFGTLVPLLLDKIKIDPALATGPFVTTSNDILGLTIYFLIAYFMYA